MAKYNASKHTIESDDGRTLATLTTHVETAQAWEVADWWGGNNAELEQLNSEVANASFNLDKARERTEYAERELSCAKEEVAAAQRKIEAFESELAALKSSTPQPLNTFPA
jgi:chromosome segregation ATPase